MSIEVQNVRSVRVTPLGPDGEPRGSAVVFESPVILRPDQLDQEVALATNQIRRDANDARRRLGIRPVDYPVETAGTVAWGS